MRRRMRIALLVALALAGWIGFSAYRGLGIRVVRRMSWLYRDENTLVYCMVAPDLREAAASESPAVANELRKSADRDARECTGGLIAALPAGTKFRVADPIGPMFDLFGHHSGTVAGTVVGGPYAGMSGVMRRRDAFD